MKKSRFTEQQICFALHQADTGTHIDEVCCKMGVSQANFYNWKQKYSGLGQFRTSLFKALGRRKPIAQKSGCRLNVRQAHAQGCDCKKSLNPAFKRTMVDYLQAYLRMSINRSCALVDCAKFSCKTMQVTRAMTRCYAFASRRQHANTFVMAMNASISFYSGKAGRLIISVCIAFIARRDLNLRCK